MTVGKDVSMLFPDVLNCIQTGNIELKKLVYLYLMNYAKSNPELALLAVNTFVRDSADPNPLVRGLAIRTMGCIRVERITEYLCEPLDKCLRDDDPYVRKTAAVAGRAGTGPRRASRGVCSSGSASSRALARKAARGPRVESNA